MCYSHSQWMVKLKERENVRKFGREVCKNGMLDGGTIYLWHICNSWGLKRGDIWMEIG